MMYQPACVNNCEPPPRVRAAITRAQLKRSQFTKHDVKRAVTILNQHDSEHLHEMIPFSIEMLISSSVRTL